MSSVLFPATAAEAASCARANAGIFIAGGTALQLVWEGAAPACLIDLSHLPGWRDILRVHGNLRLGAGVTLESCRTEPQVARLAPLLAQAVAGIGAFAVRNRATLGGNVCWRQGDSLPALLTLNAVLEFGDGSLLPLADWLRQPPQASPPLLVAVRVPCPSTPSQGFFEKLGHRAVFTPTLALACGTIAVDETGVIRQAKLAVSGSGIRPVLLPQAGTLCGEAARSHGWRAAFEAGLHEALAALQGAVPYQRQVLQRLLAGHVYRICEGTA